MTTTLFASDAEYGSSSATDIDANDGFGRQIQEALMPKLMTDAMAMAIRFAPK